MPTDWKSGAGAAAVGLVAAGVGGYLYYTRTQETDEALLRLKAVMKAREMLARPQTIIPCIKIATAEDTKVGLTTVVGEETKVLDPETGLFASYAIAGEVTLELASDTDVGALELLLTRIPCRITGPQVRDRLV